MPEWVDFHNSSWSARSTSKGELFLPLVPRVYVENVDQRNVRHVYRSDRTSDAPPIQFDIVYRRDLAKEDEVAFLFGIKGVDLAVEGWTRLRSEFGIAPWSARQTRPDGDRWSPLLGAAARINASLGGWTQPGTGAEAH